MAGSFTSVHQCEKSLLIPEVDAIYRTRPVGERAIEVLPALQSLFLEELHPSGPVEEAIGKFVAARQLAGHLIIVSHWDRKMHG